MTETSATTVTADDVDLRSVRILDVRTPGEFGSAHIDGAVNLPLDLLPAHAGAIAARAGEPVVVVCQSGARARRAAELLRAQGASDVAVLEGGMTAWSGRGRPATHGTPRWAMERQVRLVAGSVVLGSVLASLRFPRAKFVAGAIGGGLTFSALTDTCAMATVLGRLPYNRVGRIDADGAVQRLTAAR